MRHLTFLTFPDERSAFDALSSLGGIGEDGEALWIGNVDAGFPVYTVMPTETNAGTLASGYFVNVLTNGRDADLEALSAWTGTAEEDASSPDGWKLIAGSRPQTPQRVFA